MPFTRNVSNFMRMSNQQTDKKRIGAHFSDKHKFVILLHSFSDMYVCVYVVEIGNHRMKEKQKKKKRTNTQISPAQHCLQTSDKDNVNLLWFGMLRNFRLNVDIFHIRDMSRTNSIQCHFVWKKKPRSINNQTKRTSPSTTGASYSTRRKTTITQNDTNKKKSLAQINDTGNLKLRLYQMTRISTVNKKKIITEYDIVQHSF